MRPYDVEGFRWPPGIEEKISSKHGLSRLDVEGSFFASGAVIRKGRAALQLHARTESGAYIIVIFALRTRHATIITARQMTRTERRMYRRK